MKSSQKGLGTPFLSSGGSSVRIVLAGETESLSIFGVKNRTLKLVRKSFKARLSVRGNVLTTSGSVAERKRVFPVFSELIQLNRHNGSVTREMMEQALQYARRRSAAIGQASSDAGAVALADRSLSGEAITLPSSRKSTHPRISGTKTSSCRATLPWSGIFYLETGECGVTRLSALTRRKGRRDNGFNHDDTTLTAFWITAKNNHCHISSPLREERRA